jgi:hypothetical protein
MTMIKRPLTCTDLTVNDSSGALLVSSDVTGDVNLSAGPITLASDGTTAVVAAVALKSIEVWGIQVTLNTAAGSIIFKSATTSKLGIDAAITGGMAVAPGSMPLFTCAVGEALNATLVGGPGKGNVQYRLV